MDSRGEIKSPECLSCNMKIILIILRIFERAFCKQFCSAHIFATPEESGIVATVNSDGSKAIIRDLDAISNVLDTARKEKYLIEIKKIRDEIVSKLNVYYEPEYKEQNNIRTRTIVGNIRRTLDLSIGTRPETFGMIIDQIMLPVGDLRKIAYDIIVLKTETPEDFNEITLIRTITGINPNDDKELIFGLCNYYACDDSSFGS